MRFYGGGEDVFPIFERETPIGDIWILLGLLHWTMQQIFLDRLQMDQGSLGFLKILKPRSSHSPKVLGKHYLKREKVFRGRKTPQE